MGFGSDGGSMENDNLVSGDELAHLFNMTDRRVQQLATEGVVHKKARGMYLREASISGYIKFLQERIYGDRAIGSDLQKARARESRLKGDKLHMELLKEAGVLVSVDDFEYKLGILVTNARQELLLIPEKVKNQINATYQLDIDSSFIDKFVLDSLKEISKQFCTKQPDKPLTNKG